MKTYEGGCHCGAVRYEARGDAVNIRACHCTSCRKVAGGPFHVRAIFPVEAVSRHGRTERFRSSTRLWRLFCPACSTYLFGEPIDRPGYLSINVDSLDDPGALAPEMHIWVESKIPWVTLDDGLPQHAQGAPW